MSEGRKNKKESKEESVEMEKLMKLMKDPHYGILSWERESHREELDRLAGPSSCYLVQSDC